MLDNTSTRRRAWSRVRAVMENADEALWPGTLVNVTLITKVEDAVTVPAVAVQTGQIRNVRVRRQQWRGRGPACESRRAASMATR